MSAHFKIVISKITFYDIEKLQNKTGYLQYEVLEYPETKEYKTTEFKVNDNQLDLCYKQNVKIPKVTKDILWFYMNENIIFRLYFRGIEMIQKIGKTPPPIIASSRKQSMKTVGQTIEVAKTFAKNRERIPTKLKNETEQAIMKRTESKANKGCELF